MTFLEKIINAQQTNRSLLCIGLDTDIKKIPSTLKNDPDPVASFNKAIIEATKDLACTYKPNIAYYEAMGTKGFGSIEKTLDAIPKYIFTIVDAKRGDIGSTSDQYAFAYQQALPFDAITLSPYMGYDSVEPFLRDPARGAIFLGVTSNPGAKDFQYLELANGKKIYEQVTDTVNTWNEQTHNCGLVVGATKPSELEALRMRAPKLPFLVPGVGAQGGSLEDVLKANGSGIAIINASRSIIYASGGSDFAEAARREAEKLVSQMRALYSF
ncbi:MAG TPA: orotidine-5'-phosphate decarboxylase [Candidatus Kapabacteria bacterium]|nr:orotidine-5'-phosphate decarboxylase [Candidatus Kapabacteria bacterium]